MTPWHVIRCSYHHTPRVIEVIERGGWQVWSPAQLVIIRQQAGRRHTEQSAVFKQKWLPLLPGCLFSPIRALPDALGEWGRYPCHLTTLADGATPAQIAFAHLRRFMDQIDGLNAETYRQATPRRPAVRQKREWRDLKSGLAELAATNGVKLEAA